MIQPPNTPLPSSAGLNERDCLNEAAQEILDAETEQELAEAIAAMKRVLVEFGYLPADARA